MTLATSSKKWACHAESRRRKDVISSIDNARKVAILKDRRAYTVPEALGGFVTRGPDTWEECHAILEGYEENETEVKAYREHNSFSVNPLKGGKGRGGAKGGRKGKGAKKGCEKGGGGGAKKR